MQTLSVDQLVGQTLGNYRVERLLGQGRLNAVYLAQNLFEQRTDALTLYLVPERFSLEARQRFLVRFLKEAAAISTLKNQYILPVCEYGERGGYPYLVTPYMTNGSLADTIKQQGRCSHIEVLDILEQVASGLEYAHNRGHIHGMLRPSNIVLDSDQNILVAGFGLMHMLQMSGIDQTNRPYAHLLSVVETFMIAPEYVAPEIVQGQAIDRRSDVYALGAVLFELLSGQPPFSGTNTLDVAMQHVNQPAPSLRSLAPDAPVALASVINQALEREPDRRFQHVSELVEAFSQVSKGAVGRVHHTTEGQPAVRSSRPREGTSERTTTGSWQLLPPIVTGKLYSVPSSSLAPAPINMPQNAPAPTRINMPQNAPTPTRINMPQNAPAPAPMNVAQNAPTPVRVPQEQPQAQSRAEASETPRQDSGHNNGMQPFDWWSMPGQLQDIASAPTAAKDSAPMRAAELPRSQSTLRLSDAEAENWGSQPQRPSPRQAPRPRAKKRSAGVQRRQVVAMLAVGGVLAVGGAAVFKLHAMGTSQMASSSHAAAAATNGQAHKQTTQTSKQATTATSKQPMSTAGHTGTVIGQSSMPVNSAADFTNPTNDQSDILIRLTNGSFVAYDRACTHQGVLINYDPNTHMLICPAHGAIFDPSKDAKVIQGPAQTPVAKVPVRLNTDGTITSL